MNKNNNKSYIFYILLSCIAVLLSLVSLYDHVRFEVGQAAGAVLEPSFCNVSEAFNCEKINQSAWSELFRVPLASYAAVFYLFLALLGLGGLKRKLKNAPAMLSFLSLFALLYSLFMAGVSYFIIGAMCLMCTGLYIVTFLLWLITVFGLKQQDSASYVKKLASGFSALLNLPRRTQESASGYITVVAIVLALWAAALTLVLPGLFEQYARANNPEFSQAVINTKIKRYLAEWKSTPVQEITIEQDDPTTRDYSKGSSDAPIHIVEFFDYECPACKDFYLTTRELQEEFEDKIKVTFKNYPLNNECNDDTPSASHKNACYAVKLARCAGEFDRFEAMNDYLLTLPSGNRDEASVKQSMKAGLAKIELKYADVARCMVSAKVLEKIKSDASYGKKLGVNATPSVWINGKRVKSPSFEVMKTIIEDILAK